MLNGVERNGTEKARGSNNDHDDHSGGENGDGDGSGKTTNITAVVAPTATPAFLLPTTLSNPITLTKPLPLSLSHTTLSNTTCAPPSPTPCMHEQMVFFDC